MRETFKARFQDELVLELRLLKSKWWIILLGGIMQYVHGAFTAVAYHMHVPQEHPLKDLGFMILPELGEEYDWLSESLFYTLFVSFFIFTFTPFVRRTPKFYTVVLFSRFFCIVVTCQMLRVLSFLSTGLPGPAYHCRLGKPTATLAWPQHWWQNIFFDVGRQASHSCGDLLFSSHTIFILNGAYTYSVYGSWKAIKAAVWVAVTAICCLIIASRKHYTVDVVVAWYVVPLVFFTWKRFWKIDRLAECGPAEQKWSAVDVSSPGQGDLEEGLGSGSEQKHWVQMSKAVTGQPLQNGAVSGTPADDESSALLHHKGRAQQLKHVSMNGFHTAPLSASSVPAPDIGQPTHHHQQSQSHQLQHAAPAQHRPSRSAGSVESVAATSGSSSIPASRAKMVSSPPPGRADVADEAVSTSVNRGRGGAVTNRTQAPPHLADEISRRLSQPEELQYPAHAELPVSTSSLPTGEHSYR